MEINSNNMMMQMQAMQNIRPIPSVNIENADDAALWNAAKEFEAYFVQVMFREMRNSINTDSGILPVSQAENIFRNMLDEEVARSAAGSNGIGLARQIFNQMTANRNPLFVDSDYKV